MLRWSYIQNPPLDHAAFWICCSYHSHILTDRRDWKEHNLLDSKHHQKVPGKQKGNTPALQFGLRTISLSSTIGSCSFLDMWCAQSLPSFWTVEIGNSFSSKVSCIVNSSSYIFRQARFYSDLGRSNRWIIMILRYIMHNSMMQSDGWV